MSEPVYFTGFFFFEEICRNKPFYFAGKFCAELAGIKLGDHSGAGNSIERWWQQLESAQKHPEGSFKVVNALAMAASYDPDPTQFLGIRLPVTFDTCEVIEERWANWLRQDPVVAIETKADNLRRLKALWIDCGEKDQFNLLYGVRRFVRRLNELGIAHRYDEFPDNHTSVDYRMDESLPFLAQALSG